MDYHLEIGEFVRNLIGFSNAINDFCAAINAKGERYGKREIQIILLLWNKKGLTLGEISEQTGIHLPNVSKVISDLDALGLLFVSQGKRDKRNLQVSLSQEGLSKAFELANSSIALINNSGESKRQYKICKDCLKISSLLAIQRRKQKARR